MTNEIAMAQDQNPTATNGQLIENKTIEQLLIKISEMRRNNLTAKQQQNLKKLIRRVTESFGQLTWQYFEINGPQIQELSDQEFEALFLLVYERAKKASVYTKILDYIVWLILHNIPNTIFLTNSIRKIRSQMGNSFNLVKIAKIIRGHYKTK
ncbi:MAG: hypothetical protein HYX20_00690 [Candidatus Yanofskybacteria bacterium]|nr:hypothetical protein [Candidatus Yanofskybacteria bacterium]